MVGPDMEAVGSAIVSEQNFWLDAPNIWSSENRSGWPGDSDLQFDLDSDFDFNNLPELSGISESLDLPLLFDELPSLLTSSKGSHDSDTTRTIGSQRSGSPIVEEQLVRWPPGNDTSVLQEVVNLNNLEKGSLDADVECVSKKTESPFSCLSPSSSSNSVVGAQLPSLEQISQVPRVVDDHGSQEDSDKSANRLSKSWRDIASEGREMNDVCLKKQIRLLRNRESASQSRERKKSYIKDLEVKCRLLESQCSQLQQKVSLTTTENVVLKEELERVKKMKGSTGVAEPAVLVKDSLPLEFLSHLTCLLLLAELFLVDGLFLELFLLLVHQLLPNPKARPSSWANGPVDVRGCLFKGIGGSLIWSPRKVESLFAGAYWRKRAFSCWKRRIKYNLNPITLEESVFSLVYAGFCKGQGE